MVYSELTLQQEQAGQSQESGAKVCEEKRRLQAEFLEAVHEVNVLQSEQTLAVVNEDLDFGRFDFLIHMAQEKKDSAKYALMSHIENHRCEESLWP